MKISMKVDELFIKLLQFIHLVLSKPRRDEYTVESEIFEHCSHAFSVDDLSTILLVLFLGDPLALEGGEG